jgi:hypothetical protein
MACITIGSLLVFSLYWCSTLCQRTIPRISIHDNTTHFVTARTQSSINSCSVGGYSSCGNGLPDNFCCPSSTTCLSVAANTTAICCPNGADCGAIKPIICNIDVQNATAFPQSQIHTTNLDESLPSCGTNTCCPFGYQCNESMACELDQNSTSTIQGSTTTSPASPQPTSQYTTASEPSPTPTSSATNGAPFSTVEYSGVESSNKAGIAVGSTVGAVSIVGTLFYCWLRWRTGKPLFNLPTFARPWQQIRSPSTRELSRLPSWRDQSKYGQPEMINWNSSHDVVEGNQIAELPATPLSFSFWDKDQGAPPVPPKSCYHSYSRPFSWDLTTTDKVERKSYQA